MEEASYLAESPRKYDEQGDLLAIANTARAEYYKLYPYLAFSTSSSNQVGSCP